MPDIPSSIAGLTLADERIAWWFSTTPPAKPNAITSAELATWENVAGRCFADGSYLRAVGSESVTRPLLNGANKSGFGRSNYEGQIDVARFLDSLGHSMEDEDMLWQALKVKGTKLYFATRVGPKWDSAPTAKDEISVFEVTTDTPQDPQSFSDYISKIVPLAISDAWLDQTLAA